VDLDIDLDEFGERACRGYAAVEKSKLDWFVIFLSKAV
jgi:hypothetical protein